MITGFYLAIASIHAFVAAAYISRNETGFWFLFSVLACAACIFLAAAHP